MLWIIKQKPKIFDNFMINYKALIVQLCLIGCDLFWQLNGIFLLLKEES